MEHEARNKKRASRAKKPFRAAYCILRERGFTLVEVVIAVSIVVILTLAAIYAVNPVQQFAQGRNTQRKANLEVILNAVGQNIVDNRGTFSCSSGAIPTSTARMASSSPNYNIGPCLVPIYLQTLPYDPSTSGAKWAGVGDYDTGYAISQNASTGRITVTAPAAEVSSTISFTR